MVLSVQALRTYILKGKLKYISSFCTRYFVIAINASDLLLRGNLIITRREEMKSLTFFLFGIFSCLGSLTTF